VPADATLIPQPICEKFDVIDATDYADWLLEQIDVEFNLTNTKMSPLQAGGGFDKLTAGRTIGIIVFELRHPADSTSSPQAEGNIAERFEPAARLGGAALDMLETIGRQQWYAESFAQLFSGPYFARWATQGRQRAADSVQRTAFSGQLAEMAAGAAHEMNNPLSVISGRAQLLAKSENDAERKRILEQIQQNAGELSAIIDDLMSYANPEKPRPTETAVRQIIDEATDLTRQKKGVSQLDIKIDVPPDTSNVFVDSAQIASAVANIICNGLESYDSGSGPITIQTAADKAKGDITLQVIDSGRGMDEQTLARAAQPFFSARPAGRKRGMGLAHAQRLIEINNGTLDIASQPGKGTTVTVELPCK
jgi:signal transduction histidine kinase